MERSTSAHTCLLACQRVLGFQRRWVLLCHRAAEHFLITGRVRCLHVTMETSVAIHQPITAEQNVVKKLTR